LTSITGVPGPAGGVLPRLRPRTMCPLTITDTPSGTISRSRPPNTVAYTCIRAACSIAWVKSTSTSPNIAVTVRFSGTTQRPSRRAGPKIPVITRPPSSRTGCADGTARSTVSSASSPSVRAEKARWTRSACSSAVSRPSLIASPSIATTRSRSASDARKSRGDDRGLMDPNLSCAGRCGMPASAVRAGVGCTGRAGTCYPWGMTDGAIESVLDRTSQDEIRLVRFLYADHGGIVRGKAAGTTRLRERMASGIGHTVAMMAMSMLDQLQPVAGMGPVGEVRIVPDPDTFVVLPYAPGAGAMLADLVKPGGSPWEACPRTFLKQAIAELARAGYAMQAAFEPEFTVGHRESSPTTPAIPDRLVPIDDSLCYSATGFHQGHDFAMELVGAMEAQGLEVEHYYPELGHGQHELSIRHASALRAADNHVLYRETVRGVAFRHGLWASLAPKPIPDQPGNGTHLHASLTELAADGTPGGRNAFADPADRNGLSRVGYHFIGGLLAHLPALVALTCGSVNSYRRLAPQMWASAYTCYGMDNREAAIRICSPLRGDPGSSVNLELKPSDSSANPYLALGAFIYAGLDGIRGKLDPGEAVNVDPATLTDAERAAGNTHRLPASLNAALQALAADEMIMSLLGPLRSTAYLAVKRSEAAHFATSTDPYYECFQHFTKI